MHSILLTLAATVVPILALIFVAGLFAYKLYIKIRCHYDATVNCWFCNENTKVPFMNRNSFVCPKCDQYNGFTKDGDYNCDMLMQRDTSKCSNSSSSTKSACANAYYRDIASSSPSLNNGLCDQCNEAQRLKVEKLAQFEPKHESRFEQELKIYRNQLEQQFRLCSSCERHVNKVLHEKKKMVLGSKFLNFIIKGAALLKQPHFNRLARAQQQRKLQRYQFLMTLLTIGNVIALLCGMPLVTREQFITIFGQHLAKPIFFIYSHLLTLLRVICSMLEEQQGIAKLLLYARTFSKLLLYSVGLSQLQVQHATLGSCYINLYPYMILGLSFLHNICDGLKFTRYTLLLVLWSVYAKGSLVFNETIDENKFIFVGSIITFLLLAIKPSNLLKQSLSSIDETADESFHRLCADECISDEETISMLSQQLNCSAGSNSSSMAMPSHNQSSICNNETLRQRILNNGMVDGSINRAPSVLSLNSLHLSSQRNGFGGQRRPQSSGLYTASSMDQLGSWRSNYVSSPNPYTDWPQYHHHHHHHQQQQQQQQQQHLQHAGGSLYSPPNPSTRSTYRNGEKLLMPSRLLTIPKNMNHGNHDVNAWVMASSGQDLQQDTIVTAMQTSLSRTSSQSSGFESQPRPESQANCFAFASAPTPAPTSSLHHMPFHDYGWQKSAALAPSLAAPSPSPLSIVPPPLASPLPPTSSSLYSHTPNDMPFGANRSHYQPGDLLRKWVDSTSRATPQRN